MSPPIKTAVIGSPDLGPCLPVQRAGEHLAQLCIAGTALHGNRTLPWRRHEGARVESGLVQIASRDSTIRRWIAIETSQPRRCQYDRLVFAVLELA